MLGRRIPVAAVLAMGIALAGPVDGAAAQDRAPDNDYWWPDRLNLDPLRQTSPESNPLGDDFDYREAFDSVDLPVATRIRRPPRTPSARRSAAWR